MFEDAEVISVYTRAQALEDGVLVDVSTVAREAGIKYPVAMTRASWEKCVPVPECLKGIQDESGRLWDVLWMLRCAIRKASGVRIHYEVYVQKDRRPIGPACLVKLKALCHPGDTMEPVITIMLPEED